MLCFLFDSGAQFSPCALRYVHHLEMCEILLSVSNLFSSQCNFLGNFPLSQRYTLKRNECVLRLRARTSYVAMTSWRWTLAPGVNVTFAWWMLDLIPWLLVSSSAVWSCPCGGVSLSFSQPAIQLYYPTRVTICTV